VSAAQKIGIAPHIGSLGVGADIAVGFHPRFSVRAGLNIFPIDINVTSGDVAYSVSVSSPQVTAMADLYLVGGFRLSGGFLVSSDDILLKATPDEPVEIGGGVYQPEEIGTLTGTFSRNTMSPYVGIGFGNPAASKIGFFLDLGVGYSGRPSFELSASGPILGDPQFQDDIAREEQRIQEDIEDYRFYPVVSLGFSIGF
jgi:hypothetical protein